jgi:hypothetical protein
MTANSTSWRRETPKNRRISDRETYPDEMILDGVTLSANPYNTNFFFNFRAELFQNVIL